MPSGKEHEFLPYDAASGQNGSLPNHCRAFGHCPERDCSINRGAIFSPARGEGYSIMQHMDIDEVKKKLKAEAAEVDKWLARCFENRAMPEGLGESMRYSLLGGGKRIRPVLCLLSARLCGLTTDAVLPFAGALECIHTYSLIHDDLPAMDNDDLRRGKPSNHKRFDEATALLAGDALLTDAFALMASAACRRSKHAAPSGQGGGASLDTGDCQSFIPAQRVLRAIALVAAAAGSAGMVGGQFMDMLFTAREDVSLEALATMHAMKTGALLRVACEAGAALAGANPQSFAALSEYGSALGLAFQITDDILDETGDEAILGKPVGSDAALRKCTYPALMGLNASRERALAEAKRAEDSMAVFAGPDADFLKGLAAYIVNRVS